MKEELKKKGRDESKIMEGAKKEEIKVRIKEERKQVIEASKKKN